MFAFAWLPSRNAACRQGRRGQGPDKNSSCCFASVTREISVKGTVEGSCNNPGCLTCSSQRAQIALLSLRSRSSQPPRASEAKSWTLASRAESSAAKRSRNPSRSSTTLDSTHLGFKDTWQQNSRSRPLFPQRDLLLLLREDGLEVGEGPWHGSHFGPQGRAQVDPRTKRARPTAPIFEPHHLGGHRGPGRCSSKIS